MPNGAVPPLLETNAAATSAADAAFASFLQGALPGLRQFLGRLVGNAADAEDVAQETLVKVWRLRSGFDPERGGMAWLRQAAFRTFCDHRRRRCRGPIELASAESVATPQVDVLELREEVQETLRRLAPIERALLLGFHAEGRSILELAARHALTINTVKSHLHRARRRLQETKDANERP